MIFLKKMTGGLFIIWVLSALIAGGCSASREESTRDSSSESDTDSNSSSDTETDMNADNDAEADADTDTDADADTGADTDTDTNGDGDTDTIEGSPGCNGNAEPLSTQPNEYLTIDVNGQAREYMIELPTDYDGITPQPVVFAFHGTTTTSEMFLGRKYGNGREGAAGRVILVAPQGEATNAGGTGWLTLSGSGEISQEDLDFFDALVEMLKANYCIDPGRIFSYGHSAGGLFSNYLGCYRGDVLRGIGPFAGWGPNRSITGKTIASDCVGEVAVFIGHNPYEGFPEVCAETASGNCPWIVGWKMLGWPSTQHWTEQNGCDEPGEMPAVHFDGDSATGDPLPCKDYAGCDPNNPVKLCLYDWMNDSIGPHAFPTNWGTKAVIDFFLTLP